MNLMKQRQLNEKIRLFENDRHPGRDQGMDKLARDLDEAKLNEEKDRLLTLSKPDPYEML